MKADIYATRLYYKLRAATDPILVRERITSALSRKEYRCKLYSEKCHPGISYRNVLHKMIIGPHNDTILNDLKAEFPEFKIFWLKDEYKQGRYFELYISTRPISTCVIM